MDKSNQILKIARDRLGNQPTYNPVDFLEMCAVVRDELEAAEQKHEADLLKAEALRGSTRGSIRLMSQK